MNREYSLQPLIKGQEAVGPMYDNDDCRQLLEIYRGYYDEIGYNPPWIAYLVVDNGKAMGTCGFVSKPIDGRVEIAYWTFRDFEGQGVASFGCAALVEMAKRHDEFVVITAKTAPVFGPSTSILSKNGFIQTRIVQDHEIGDAWEWIYEGTK
jgi:[ribosomal protein S5]-alanine N-acetyltransferase